MDVLPNAVSAPPSVSMRSKCMPVTVIGTAHSLRKNPSSSSVGSPLRWMDSRTLTGAPRDLGELSASLSLCVGLELGNGIKAALYLELRCDCAYTG